MTKKKNQNTSVWIKSTEEKGLDARFLERDESEKMYEILDSLGLPRTRVYYPSKREIENLQTGEIFSQHPCFCRLIPKSGGIRPYNLEIRSAEELRDFYSENPGDYQAMLVERGNVTHAGAIIAKDESTGNPGKCTVELVEGTGEDLAHGLRTPVSTQIDFPGRNWFRIFKYDREPTPTEKERSLITQAIKLIGGINHPFPGYYEFDVVDGTRIIFKKYQKQKTAYGRL